MSDEAPNIVLASQSPRRAQLLDALGLRFDIAPADIDESLHADEDPVAYALRLARGKAAAVAAVRPDAIVIGADTVVVIDGIALGKPRDDADAVDMLLRLQGRTHTVATGLAIVGPGGATAAAVERTEVRFRPFGRRTAERYVATGEPKDKAGAYGIQDAGSALVEGITGDFFTVMGLPVARLVALLEAIGWRYDFDGLERA
jgi:septum formation protein